MLPRRNSGCRSGNPISGPPPGSRHPGATAEHSLMLAITALLLCAGPLLRPPALLLSVEPERPVRGSLVRLVATDTAQSNRPWSWVEGTAGGEPLHFEAQGVGRFVALAGIPIEGPDSFPVTLRISYGDGTQDTVAASVFVRQPDYTMEKLRVAPAMAKPDSAALVRIDQEIARAREIGRSEERRVGKECRWRWST